MQLSNLFELYASARLPGSPDNTLNKHTAAIAHYAEFLGRPPTTDDLAEGPVLSYAHWLVRRRNLAAATASCYHSRILAQWSFAWRQGLVPKGPEQQKLKVPKRTPIAWTRDELRRLWLACESLTGKIAGLPANLWMHSLHSAGWDTMERITALTSSRWSEFRSPWLTIRAECRKGRREDATYRLHDTTVEMLDRFRTRRELIWPWPYHPTSLWRLYNRMLSDANLPCDRLHKFHCLRRSAASYYEAMGGDATRALRHTSRAVTLENYIDPTVAAPPQASDLLFRP